VVRIDVKLFCDPGSGPTGNLAGALPDARLTFINGNVPVEPQEAISVGKQTVPFKQIGEIRFPLLEIQKTVTTSGGTCPGADDLTVTSGDTVRYCYVVTNPGSAPLYNVELFDDNGTPGSGNTADDFAVALSLLTDVDGDGTEDDLAAGGTATGEAEVTLYFTSVDPVINTGTATGDDSIIEPTTLTDSDTAAVTVVGIPSINLTKTGVFNDEDGDGYADVGETITYTYTVTNDGELDLTNVDVTDSLGIAVTCAADTLAPGESTTCTASYPVTQSDITRSHSQISMQVRWTTPQQPSELPLTVVR